MKKIYKLLIDTLIEEVHELNLGHPFNKKRIEFMKSIVTMLAYLQYAVLTDDEILSILSIYNNS